MGSGKILQNSWNNEYWAACHSGDSTVVLEQNVFISGKILKPQLVPITWKEVQIWGFYIFTLL